MSLTVPEAAVRYGVTQQHLRKLLGVGTLKGVKRASTWFIHERSATAYFAKEHKTGPKPRGR
jgi:hypothetical protein